GEARRGLQRRTTAKPRIESSWELGSQAPGPLRRWLDRSTRDLHQQAVDAPAALGLEKPVGLTHQEGESDLRERIEVRFGSDVSVPTDLFGRHVQWSAEATRRVDVGALGDDLGNAEIQQLE